MHTSLEKHSPSIEKLVDLTQESPACFYKHTYNIKHQFECIQCLKSNLQEDEAIIHVDYNENYNCKRSREIIKVHFRGSHRQVTLHTEVLYLSGGRLESFASVSDCLRYDAAATWVYLDPVLEYIRGDYTAVSNCPLPVRWAYLTVQEQNCLLPGFNCAIPQRFQSWKRST